MTSSEKLRSSGDQIFAQNISRWGEDVSAFKFQFRADYAYTRLYPPSIHPSQGKSFEISLRSWRRSELSLATLRSLWLHQSVNSGFLCDPHSFVLETSESLSCLHYRVEISFHCKVSTTGLEMTNKRNWMHFRNDGHVSIQNWCYLIICSTNPMR